MTRALVVVASILLVGSAGCWWIQEASERDACDRALEKVCACASVDCSAASPPAIVEVLRRCDSDEIVRDRDYHLSICIQDSPAYCDVLSGLISASPSVCAIECNQESACDQEQACHDFQYGSCDVPAPDGGPDAS